MAPKMAINHSSNRAWGTPAVIGPVSKGDIASCVLGRLEYLEVRFKSNIFGCKNLLAWVKGARAMVEAYNPRSLDDASLHVH